ncbi:MAG: mandelate racemase/muconate lactonizing enzyme family protein [Betaproteobacteria bacterium]
MQSTLEAVECWVLRAPIAEPLANAFGAMSSRPAVFVRLSASDGAWGWGEAFCNFPQVGAEHRARLVDSIFAPLLKGASADDITALRTLMETRTRQMVIQCGEPGPFAQVAGAIDQAMWDMAARRAGVPLWKHLGGARDHVNAYASGLGPDRVVDVALAKRAQGFRAFKLKVGFGAERDRRNLADLRAALGAAATIMVDANQAWDPSQAPARIAELAPFGPLWVEEPMLADESAQAWRTLAAASVVPLAAGENIRGRAAFDAALDGGWLRFVQPDVGKWGGISGCREVAAHAASRDVTLCPHWLGGGVGLAASLHLVAATGSAASYAEVDANPNPLREEVLEVALADGAAVLGSAPGIGVEPDLRRLRAYLVDTR